MSNNLPLEILEEIEQYGGVDGLRGGLPQNKWIERVAKHYEILSSPIRLQVLLTLNQGTLCVCVLKKITGCTDTMLSYHLSTLRRHKLISSKREKSFLKYFLTEKGKGVVNSVLYTIELQNNRSQE